MLTRDVPRVEAQPALASEEDSARLIRLERGIATLAADAVRDLLEEGVLVERDGRIMTPDEQRNSHEASSSLLH